MKKILIVEDEESLAFILKQKLTKEGFQAMLAVDGEVGLEKIREWKPDLILLDIVMPKIDGYQVLEKMEEEKIKIPVIIISNSGQPVEIERTKRLGAVDALVKTELDPGEVVEKVKNYIVSIGVNKEDKIKERDIRPQEKPMKKQTNNQTAKILLVEDDSFLREICAKKLTKEGFNVHEALDGEMAVQDIGGYGPDIVLLDIILPALDGFAVLKKIREHEDEKIKKVPVIMLSNLGQKDDVEKAMSLGANGYLIKAHFTTEEIISKVKKLWKNKKTDEKKSKG